jgi:hypothetical protein
MWFEVIVLILRCVARMRLVEIDNPSARVNQRWSYIDCNKERLQKVVQ